MTAKFAISCVIAVGCLGFSIGAQGAAPSAPTGRVRGAAKTAAEASEVTALRPALELLRTADHDYQGHRVKAMEAIAEACRLLGTPVTPGTRGAANRGSATRGGEKPKTPGTHPATEPEAQPTSDGQLKQAQTIVQQVLAGIPAGTQPRVTEKLQDAVSELNTALAIK